MSLIDAFINIVTELGKIVYVILRFVFWDKIVVWAGMTIQSHAGEGAKWLYYIVLFVVIPFIVVTWSIAKTQAGIESMHATLTGIFLKLLAIGLAVFVITFVLSSM